MSGRKLRLLFVSPVLPAPSGNGLAMRAGMTLTALAARYDVWLLVVPLYSSPEGILPGIYAARCRGVVVLATGQEVEATIWHRWAGVGWGPRVIRASPARWVDVAADCFARERFEVVHVFRMAALPFAEGYLRPEGRAGPRRHIDLDDIESRTQVRLAALYRANGDPAGARQAEAEAVRCAAIEDGVLAAFDRVYVCSDTDREALRGRGSAEVRVLPNAVPLRGPLRLEAAEAARTFLFVGTLGYYPNQDGALWFCRQVWPAIQEATSGRCRLLIAGPGAGPEVRALGAITGVQVLGMVPDVLDCYAQAAVAVVPIRAAGGTRIKILEAFSYRRPVVSTATGAEGLAVRGDQELLIADAPGQFAAQCLRLLAEPALGRELAQRAFALLREAYSPGALARVVASDAVTRR